MTTDDLVWVPGTHLIEVAWSVLRCPDPDGTDPSREEARAEFSRWLSSRDSEVSRRAAAAVAGTVEAQMARFEDYYCGDDGSPPTLISDIRAAVEAALHPKEDELGNVVPLRDERCDEKHEEPLRQTSRTTISNAVHFCTKNRYHGGEHYDNISGKGWRG